jgi:hypothetical protein
MSRTRTPKEPTEHNVREIVGRPWSKRGLGYENERFLQSRLLIMTAIPGGYNAASDISVILQGSPPRGHVIVPIQYLSDPAVDVLSHRALSERDTHLLRRFIHLVYPKEHIPHGWSWTSTAREMQPA